MSEEWAWPTLKTKCPTEPKSLRAVNRRPQCIRAVKTPVTITALIKGQAAAVKRASSGHVESLSMGGSGVSFSVDLELTIRRDNFCNNTILGFSGYFAIPVMDTVVLMMNGTHRVTREAIWHRLKKKKMKINLRTYWKPRSHMSGGSLGAASSAGHVRRGNTWTGFTSRTC